jgi:hypothetical protein
MSYGFFAPLKWSAETEWRSGETEFSVDTDGYLGDDIVSNPIDFGTHTSGSISLHWWADTNGSDDLAGYFYLQVATDGYYGSLGPHKSLTGTMPDEFWVDLDDSTELVSTTQGSRDTILYNLQEIGYRLCRVVWVNTAGYGRLSGHAMGKR